MHMLYGRRHTISQYDTVLLMKVGPVEAPAHCAVPFVHHNAEQ